MKKIIILLFIITPFIVFAYPKGDVDGSNKVDNKDYVLVRNHILKKSFLTGDRLKRADVDGKNGVDNVDYVLIRKTIIDKTKVTPTAKPTATPKPLSTEEQICESVKNNSSIDYKSFASLKKDNDDYYVMKAAHDCANKYNKPVVVTKGTYNIYKKNSTDPINIETSTNFSDSTIYIHDEILEPITNSSGDVVANYDGVIFQVKSKDEDCKTKKYNSYQDVINGIINSGDKYVFVKITNKNGIDTVFRRSGTHTDSGQPKTDSFRVSVKDGKANVLDPLFWSESSYNKDTIKNVIICKIPSDKLFVQNGNFITIVSSNANRIENLKKVKGNTSRNIAISRSNTTVKEMKHSYVKSESMQETDTMTYGYTGFYRFYNAADIKFSNSIVTGLDGSSNETGNSMYGLVVSSVVNMTVQNVSMHRMKGQSFEEVLTKRNYWGVTGINYCKNITFDNVRLNRVDAHCGISNLTVKNSTLGWYSVSVTGAGYTKNNSMVIENVKVLSNYYITLRGDYGSTWNGTIKIKNGTLSPTDDDIKKSKNTYLIKWNPEIKNNTLHNYGYDLYLPDIEIDGLKISNKNVTNFYVFEQSKEYFNGLKTDGFKKYYNPTITLKNITGSNSNFTYKNYKD